MEVVNTRETLLLELVDVFRRRGYEGATLNQLAQATSVGKASLYHHFPGGKAQMVELLLQHSLDALAERAFDHLKHKGDPRQKLVAFVDGFADYTHSGKSHCLVAIIGQGSAGETHRETIKSRFNAWEHDLTHVLEDSGLKPKRAHHEAQRMLAELYGALLLTRLREDPKLFRQVIKRVKRRLTLV